MNNNKPKTLYEELAELDISDDVTPLRIERGRHAILQSLGELKIGVLAMKTFRDRLKYQRDANAIVGVLEETYTILDVSFEEMDKLINELVTSVDYWKQACGEKIKESADYLELAHKAWKELQNQGI